MFFSLSSEMVMFTYGDIAEGQAGRFGGGARRNATRLGSAPLGFGSRLWLEHHVLALGIGDTMQHLVGRILDASIGTVKPPRRLGSQLAQHVTVTQRMNCLEYEIGPHSSFSYIAYEVATGSLAEKIGKNLAP
jgi:hypothetical protein